MGSSQASARASQTDRQDFSRLICMRLLEEADIYALARNCRTSVEVIQKFNASHFKNPLDAAAVNTRPLAGDRPISKFDPTSFSSPTSNRKPSGASLIRRAV
jgi:hypothetical protein